MSRATSDTRASASTSLPIPALAESFAVSLSAARKSPRTIQTYLESVRLFDAFLVEHGMPRNSGAVRREHVEAFIVDLLASYAPATASNRYRGLQSFWKRRSSADLGSASTSRLSRSPSSETGSRTHTASRTSASKAPADLDGAKALAAGPGGGYDFQWWAVGRIGARPVSDAERKKGADAGIDGEMTFTDDGGAEVKRILISVKSGGVSVAGVRDLVGTVKREDAAIGVFVTLQPPTKPMLEEAVKAGWYDSPMWGKKFRRIQIVTAEDILAGRMPDLPPSSRSGLKAAAKVKVPTAATVPLFGEAVTGTHALDNEE